MNRRHFLKSSLTASAAIIAAPALLSMQGCSESVEGILNAVLNSAVSIGQVADPSSSWLPSFQAAVTALESAETQWKAGSPIAVVETALNTLAAVTAVIPLTAAYSPLVDVLVAGIDAVLAAISGSASSQARNAAQNPHQGRVSLNKPHAFQTRVGAYKEQWNATAVVSGFPQAKIR